MTHTQRPNSSSRIVSKRILLSGIAIFGFSLFTFFTAHELAWPPGEFVADTSEIERRALAWQGVSVAGFALGIGLILLGSHHLVRVQECTHGDQP